MTPEKKYAGIPFAKMHSSGNDFIVIDECGGVKVTDKGAFAEKYCERHTGIGADGVLFISKSKKADLRMRLFQPDRSEAEMCGNGTICAAKYAFVKKYVPPRCGWGSPHESTQPLNFTIETMSGIKEVQVGVDPMDGEIWTKIDMGPPEFQRSEIPAQGEGEFLEEELEGWTVSAVNTGVPHAVVFTDRLELQVEDIAPRIRFHRVFPQGANVNFVSVKGNTLHIRTYERGVECETLGCGTGATAAVAVAKKLHRTGRGKIKVVTRGGVLYVSQGKKNLFLEGKAQIVYK